MLSAPPYDRRGSLARTLPTTAKRSTYGEERRLPTPVDGKVYSRRGKHLGRFVDGLMYDGRERCIGFAQ